MLEFSLASKYHLANKEHKGEREMERKLCKW